MRPTTVSGPAISMTPSVTGTQNLSNFRRSEILRSFFMIFMIKWYQMCSSSLAIEDETAACSHVAPFPTRPPRNAESCKHDLSISWGGIYGTMDFADRPNIGQICQMHRFDPTWQQHVLHGVWTAAQRPLGSIETGLFKYSWFTCSKWWFSIAIYIYSYISLPETRG